MKVLDFAPFVVCESENSSYQTVSAYHLYGKPGNSGENRTVHPGGNFPEKSNTLIVEVLPFSRFYRNDRNFLYHFLGLSVPGFMSRESEKVTGIL